MLMSLMCPFRCGCCFHPRPHINALPSPLDFRKSKLKMQPFSISAHRKHLTGVLPIEFAQQAQLMARLSTWPRKLSSSLRYEKLEIKWALLYFLCFRIAFWRTEDQRYMLPTMLAVGRRQWIMRQSTLLQAKMAFNLLHQS